MIKLKISCENEIEKLKILELLKKENLINKREMNPSKIGEYYKIYIDIE